MIGFVQMEVPDVGRRGADGIGDGPLFDVHVKHIRLNAEVVDSQIVERVLCWPTTRPSFS